MPCTRTLTSVKASASLDFIRLLSQNVLAFLVVVGGGLILWETRFAAEPAIQNLRLLVAAQIGSAITFVFSQEIGSRRHSADTNQR